MDTGFRRYDGLIRPAEREVDRFDQGGSGRAAVEIFEDSAGVFAVSAGHGQRLGAGIVPGEQFAGFGEIGRARDCD